MVHCISSYNKTIITCKYNDIRQRKLRQYQILYTNKSKSNEIKNNSNESVVYNSYLLDTISENVVNKLKEILNNFPYKISIIKK